MVKLYTFLIFGLCFYAFFRSRRFNARSRKWLQHDALARKEKLTMFDVRNLLIKGEKELAVKVYCEIFKTTLKNASKAVDEIEQSIQPKDFES